MNSSRQQSGVALITALIITTIAVSLAATVMYRQQIQIRLSSNIAHLEQAYLYANGMEDWAGTILKKSFDDHKTYDSLDDDWATGGRLISLPIDGGTMNGQLFDLQARLNLNTLGLPTPKKLTKAQIKAGEKQKPDLLKLNRKRIQELLKQIDPDEELFGPAENFTDILKDWIDTDQTNGNVSEDPDDDISGNGAESPYYQSMEPAYYCANTLLASTTELRLLKDMKKEFYEKLKEHISTLPININNPDAQTPININTAGKPVLMSLGLSSGAVDDIVKERKINPFEKVDNTFLQNIFSTETEFKKEDIGVQSNYFLLRGSVNINNARVFINSVLKRDKNNGKVSVIMRDFSNP